MFQLRHYRDRTNLANTPARPSNNNDWADSILGLGTPDRPSHGQNLQQEVDGYLMEGAYHLGSVRYWEVSRLFFPFTLLVSQKTDLNLTGKPAEIPYYLRIRTRHPPDPRFCRSL